VNHHSGAIASLANPYAAMPSLHTAYALIFGVSGVVLARRWWIRGMWALYPGLVVFSIIATANHFVLDAVAGATVAVLAGTLTMVVLPRWKRPGRSRTTPALRPDRACA
jgi:membrane-associated phospholipid phosphatase